MAQAIETIRRFTELVWNERDLDRALELVHPDAVFDWSNSRAPYSGVYQGPASLREFAEALFEVWEEWDPGLEEVIEIDPETVLTATLVRGRGRGSGIGVESRGAVTWSVRDGRIMQVKVFQTKADAMSDVGLPSPGSR